MKSVKQLKSDILEELALEGSFVSNSGNTNNPMNKTELVKMTLNSQANMQNHDNKIQEAIEQLQRDGRITKTSRGFAIAGTKTYKQLKDKYRGAQYDFDIEQR